MGLLPRLSKKRKAAIAETSTLRPTLQPGPSIPHARNAGTAPLVPTPEEDEDEDDPFLDPPTSDLPDIEGMFPEDSDVEEADVNETTPSPRKRRRANHLTGQAAPRHSRIAGRSLDEDDRSSDTSFLGRVSRIKVLAGNAGIARTYRAPRVFMRSGAGTTESHCGLFHGHVFVSSHLEMY
ncbi:hypothetical protein B0H11DRAFT_2251884 [Mycena galericulata]|nr:hypothetical protein B0H11DRAFT_2251884 [Mycena galericulata]